MAATTNGSGTIAIVTVTYNSAVVLPEFLDSLRAQTDRDFVLYAVDNASKDDSLAILREAESSPGIPAVVIDAGANLGIAAGNNIGIERALSDGASAVLLLNNDTVLAADMIEQLRRAANEGHIDILAPVIEGIDPVGSLWFGGGHLRRWAGFHAFHDKAGKMLARDRTTQWPAEPTDYAPTCALLVQARVFDQVGLMDPSYFIYCDDVDFAIRCHQHGYQYYVTSSARMLHKVGSLSGGGRSQFGVNWNTRNEVLLSRRYLRGPRLWVALVYIQLRTIAGFATRRDNWAGFKERQAWFGRGLRADLNDHSVPQIST